MPGMAKRSKKPQPRPALPEKLRDKIDVKQVENGRRQGKPSARSVPHRQGASRGPRG
jgi:hypothetical protein